MRGCKCLSPWRTLPSLTVVSRVGVEVGLQAEGVALVGADAVGPVVDLDGTWEGVVSVSCSFGRLPPDLFPTQLVEFGNEALITPRGLCSSYEFARGPGILVTHTCPL